MDMTKLEIEVDELHLKVLELAEYKTKLEIKKVLQQRLKDLKHRRKPLKILSNGLKDLIQGFRDFSTESNLADVLFYNYKKEVNEMDMTKEESAQEIINSTPQQANVFMVYPYSFEEPKQAREEPFDLLKACELPLEMDFGTGLNF